MLILGIESSCDETAFALVEDGSRVLSNAVASQVELHARFGGVVPEIASRAHIECLVPLYHKALSEAGRRIEDVDAIAVTRGPGLAGCLLVGVEFGKALALRHNKPLAAVHHIAGHVLSVFLGRETDAWGNSVAGNTKAFAPYACLVISGGHSSLILVREPLSYTILGETLDDAVGEAYDKVAKLLGLGYPGGPVVDRMAAFGNPDAHDLPRPLMNKGEYDFSFSGLKTAVARLVEDQRRRTGSPPCDQDVADICASFQQAAIDVLLTKAEKALKANRLNRLAIVGGVACNKGLRADVAKRFGRIQVAIPAPEFCTDNAAMIAGVGWHLAKLEKRSTLGLNAAPGLALANVGAWIA